MLPRPVVISAHHEIRVVHLPELSSVLRQTRSVAITHRVRSPFLRDRFRPFHKTFVRRYCKSSFLHFISVLLLSFFVFIRIYQLRFSCSHSFASSSKLTVTIRSSVTPYPRNNFYNLFVFPHYEFFKYSLRSTISSLLIDFVSIIATIF